MKVLLIYKNYEKTSADTLLTFFADKRIRVVTLPVDSYKEEKGGFEKQFTFFFNPYVSDDRGTEPQADIPTHVLVLSALDPGEIDFLAGFYCGSRMSCLVYGEKAVECIPKVFGFCFKVFNTEAELRNFLDSEFRISEKLDEEKSTSSARDTLLRMGVPVNEKSMAQCVYEGCLQEVLFFLAAGYSPDTRNETGVPLICIAARGGNREILRFLLLAGAEVNLLANDRGTSAIIDGTIGKHYEVVVDLIKAGAETNIQSIAGQTALIIAVGAGDEKIVEALLKSGADPDIQDNMGVSARKYAKLFNKSNVTALFDTYSPQGDGLSGAF